MLSWIRGLASEPCSRVLHGQFSKNLASLTMHSLDLTMPRRCARQVHRPNVGGPFEEYYRRTIYVPYMDSLIQSLESRFGESNTPYFHIFALHPTEMQQTERDEFKHIVSSVKEMYGIDNLVEEALAGYDVQKHKPLDDNSLGMIELVKQSTSYVPYRTDVACNIMYSGKVLQHTAQGEELVKISDEWYTSVRLLHAKCPPQQSEQPEDRANEQGHWQFRKRSPTAPIPVPSVRKIRGQFTWGK